MRSRPSFTLVRGGEKAQTASAVTASDRENLPAKVLVHELRAARFRLHDRLLSLVAADRGPRDFDPDLVGDLDLHGRVVELA